MPARPSARAEVVELDNPFMRAGRILIEAPASAVFDLLADPHQHRLFDGSNTLRGHVRGPRRLSLDATFSTRMFLKLPYRIRNHVVYFEENAKIGWRHLNHHEWVYELEVQGENSTRVTELFDARNARVELFLKMTNAYQANQIAILKSLVRLKELAEAGVARSS